MTSAREPKSKPDSCFRCRSDKVLPIRYGYPGPQMEQDARDGKIALGGCMVFPDNPEWECQRCRATWRTSEPAVGPHE